MCYRIIKVITGKVGTTAADIVTNGYKFMIRNTHDTHDLYIRDRADGAACTAANGMMIPAGTKDKFIFIGSKMSIVGSAADTTYEITCVDEVQ